MSDDKPTRGRRNHYGGDHAHRVVLKVHPNDAPALEARAEERGCGRGRGALVQYLRLLVDEDMGRSQQGDAPAGGHDAMPR